MGDQAGGQGGVRVWKRIVYKSILIFPNMFFTKKNFLWHLNIVFIEKRTDHHCLSPGPVQRAKLKRSNI